MQAVILAAGRGNRMRPLTDATHKSLLVIDNAPLIDRLLDDLESLGISDVLMVTGYQADAVESHVRARHGGLALRFVRNEAFDTTNNIVSLAIAFDGLDLRDDLLLIEADLICDRSVIQRLIESPAGNAALLDRHRSGMDGTVVTVAEGVITSVIPPHLQHSGFDFTDKYKTLNVYKFTADFCRSVFAGLLRYYAQSVDGSVYYELILGILIYLRQARIAAVMVDAHERWAEIDDPNDLAVARFTFEPSSRRAILEASLGGWWAHDVLDFCFLRNMYWPTAAMMSELRRDLPQLLQGYGSTQVVLDRKLQWWLLCSEGRATAVAGLSQVFPWLGRRLEGQRVLIPSPTFGEYHRVFPGALTYRDDFHVDLPAVEARLGDVDVCVFVTPNNPTGSEIPAEAIHAIARRHPRVLFLVDESFQGFSEQPSILPMLEQVPVTNVLLLVSLSKTLGIPGARLGYMYTCDAAWRDALRAELPIWNVGALAERVLEIGVKHRAALERALGETRRDRRQLATALRELPIVVRVMEGGADFVLAELHNGRLPSAGIVETLLADHRMIVKDVSAKIADGGTWLRLAVRLPDENQRLVSALRDLSPTEA